MMTVRQLGPLLVDENQAENFLREKKILKEFDSCPKCGSMHLGRIRRERYRCYQCKYEWNLRLGSYLESRHIELSDFIGCLKLFTDGMTASRAAEELVVSPKLTMQLFNEFRRLLIDKMYLPVYHNGEVRFSIGEVNGKIQVEVASDNIRNVGAELKCNRSIDKNRMFNFNLNYSSKKIKPVLHQISRIDELDLFYRYCQQYLYNFRGRDISLLLGILKELAFRYNHKKEDLFELLLTKLIK